MTDRLEGQVQRIRFVNEDSHWTVADLAVDGELQPEKVVGTLPGLAEGMRVEVEGERVVDSRWGQQFKAERWTELVPATKDGIAAYLASGFVPGLGDVMAGRIVERFGEETLDVIANHPDRLRDVKGLGRKRIDRLVGAFRQRRGPQEALVFLYGLGLTPGLATRIWKRYAEDTVSTVRRDPYRLAEDVKGVGFFKADQVARALGIEASHPSRVRAGAIHVLQEARGDGHCFLPRAELEKRTRELCGVAAEDVRVALESLALDGKLTADLLPGSCDQAVYLTGLHRAEVRSARHLAALLRSHPEDAPPADVGPRVAAAAEHLGIALAPGQRAACELGLSGGVVIVTGGPGTGKTTIIRTLLVAAGLPPSRIALAAPTGRAAKRMSEATALEAKTIHRLLEFQPSEGWFTRGEDDPLDADLVIVDEASMLDLPLFDALVRAIPEGARLVLVGDVDQLPPVGPGSPLTDLLKSGLVPVARLTDIFRQGAGSSIVECAHRVNRGEVPAVTRAGTPMQDFYFIDREDPDEVLETILELCSERIPRRFGLDPMRDVQVLSPMRSGAVGVDALNARLQDLLNPTGPELVSGGTSYRVGDRVMQIRNDYEKGVFNGDTGFVAKVDPGAGRLVVTVDGLPVVYERAQLDDLVLAYAVSVHKSQGSEYPAVVVPVTTQHYKMLQRNLVYTAITRGQRLVVLVGTPRALGIAVRNRDLALRWSLLDARLRSALDEGNAW